MMNFWHRRKTGKILKKNLMDSAMESGASKQQAQQIVDWSSACGKAIKNGKPIPTLPEGSLTGYDQRKAAEDPDDLDVAMRGAGVVLPPVTTDHMPDGETNDNHH